MSAGYVYVLSNPSMPGLLKIGRSKHGGAVRAKELDSSTGVPCQFDLEFEMLARNSESAEIIIHDRLDDCRFNSRREFFACPLPEAISHVVDTVCKQYNSDPEKATTPDIFYQWDENKTNVEEEIKKQGYEVPNCDVLAKYVGFAVRDEREVATRIISLLHLPRDHSHPKWQVGGSGGSDALAGLMAMLDEKPEKKDATIDPNIYESKASSWETLKAEAGFSSAVQYMLDQFKLVSFDENQVVLEGTQGAVRGFRNDISASSFESTLSRHLSRKYSLSFVVERNEEGARA